MSYFIYILQCSDKSYYTGYTPDIQKRLAVHQTGRGSKYVHSRRPFKLVYQEKYPTKRLAMQREIEIKRLTHDQKKALIK
ncbi:GIY-YIG nuclease family protein [bacterium]|nr:GIY-YIG nuclease family protein [bacterium]